MTNVVEQDCRFEVSFDVWVRRCLLIPVAFESAPFRGILQPAFLYKSCEQVLGSRQMQSTNSQQAEDPRIPGAQRDRLPNHSNAASRETHLSRRTEVAFTAKFMDAMRSSTCAVNSSRVTIVGSMSRMATYGSCERGNVFVVSILCRDVYVSGAYTAIRGIGVRTWHRPQLSGRIGRCGGLACGESRGPLVDD